MNNKNEALRILIANGVNLDLLGTREPEIYGSFSLHDLEKELRSFAALLAVALGFPAYELLFYQSNSEEKFLKEISGGWDGAIINPAAWTHTSLALGDRLAALNLPFIEVHLSKLSQREAFRHQSYSAPHALGVIDGLGINSYLAAIAALFKHLQRK